MDIPNQYNQKNHIYIKYLDYESSKKKEVCHTYTEMMDNISSNQEECKAYILRQHVLEGGNQIQSAQSSVILSEKQSSQELNDTQSQEQQVQTQSEKEEIHAPNSRTEDSKETESQMESTPTPNTDLRQSVNSEKLTNKPPIQFWPYGIKKDKFDYLKKNFKTNYVKKYKELVTQYYEKLRQGLKKKIDESQQKQLKLCKYLKNDMISIYNEKFQVSELMNKVSKQQFEDKDFINFLKELESSRENDLNEFYKRIEFFENISERFSDTQPQQIQKIVNSLISNVNFFNIELLKEAKVQINEIENASVEQKLSAQIVQNIERQEQFNLDLDTISQLIINRISEDKDLTKNLEEISHTIKLQHDKNQQILSDYQNPLVDQDLKTKIKQLQNLQEYLGSQQENIKKYSMQFGQNENQGDNNFMNANIQGDIDLLNANILGDIDLMRKVFFSFMTLQQDKKEEMKKFPHHDQNYFSSFVDYENKAKEQELTIDKLENTVAELTAQLNTNKEKITELDQKNQETEKSKNEMEQKHNSDAQKLNQELEQLKQEKDQIITQNKAALDKSQQDVKAQTDRATALDNINQQQTAKIGQLETNIQQNTQGMQQKNQEVQGLTQQIAALQQEKTTLNNTIQQQNTTIQQQNTQKQQEVAVLQQRIQTLETEKQQLQQNNQAPQ